MSINKTYSSGIALINKGKIFLIKPFMSNNDKWGIPKGHIEVNEDSKITAIREFYEETGISLLTEDINGFFISVNTQFKNTIKQVEVFKYIGNGTEQFIKSNLITEGDRKGNPENITGKWFTYNEALDVIHFYQIPIIKKLKSEDMQFKTFWTNHRTI